MQILLHWRASCVSWATFLHEPSALSAVKSLIAVEALRVVVVNQGAVNIVSIVILRDLRVNVSTPG